MTIPALFNLGEAPTAIAAFDARWGAKMPATVQTVLGYAYSSPVLQAREAAEALYAAAKQLPAGEARIAAATLAAQLADLCVAGRFGSDLGQSPRGPRLSAACARLAGAGQQDPTLDPDVLPDFAP